jgi:hypothetical protein
MHRAPSDPRAPRELLPSIAIILNAVAEGADRVPNQAEMTRRGLRRRRPADTADRPLTRRLTAPRSSRMRTAKAESSSHSAIAMNVRASASTAQTPIARTATNPCRTSRRDLRFLSEGNTASRSTGTGSEPDNACPEQLSATEIGEDGQADGSFSGDRWRRNRHDHQWCRVRTLLPHHRRVKPQTRHSGRLCRGSDQQTVTGRLGPTLLNPVVP